MTAAKETRGRVTSSHGGTSTSGVATPPPTITPITPYLVFQHSITRSKNLLKIHKEAHGTAGPPPSHLADALRAAHVLAVAALDAYIRTLVANKVVAKIKDVKSSLPPKLKDELKILLSHEVALEAARLGDLSDRVDKAIRGRFDESSFQGVQKISEVMRLIGHDDIFKDIAHSASMNEAQLKATLGQLTKRRHIIAHAGDYDLSQSVPSENAITMQATKDCIKTIEKIAQHIHILV